MTRYRLGDVVTEWTDDALWLGVLPDGPIGRFDGVGLFVLQILADGVEHEPEEIAEALHQELTDVPLEAETVVRTFLNDLAERGVVRKISV